MVHLTFTGKTKLALCSYFNISFDYVFKELDIILIAKLL